MVKISGVGSEKLKTSPIQNMGGAYYGMETPDEKYKRDETTKALDEKEQWDVGVRKEMGMTAVEFNRLQEETKEKGRVIRENNIPFDDILKDKVNKTK